MKNRPKFTKTYMPNERAYDDIFAYEEWFVGFERELREKLKSNKPYGPSPMQRTLIREVLGE